MESPPIEDLDALPYPDYGDYFAQMSPAQAETIPRQLAVETARGCWWGAKKHCTFCGLNGATLAFRSKSPDRAYDEITTLCRRYGTATVNCVDNILDPAYIETLFPRLAAYANRPATRRAERPGPALRRPVAGRERDDLAGVGQRPRVLGQLRQRRLRRSSSRRRLGSSWATWRAKWASAASPYCSTSASTSVSARAAR